MHVALNEIADDTVVNGLKLPWSTGPVEGTVTKVKLLKRAGFGRASTRLLRRRLISAAQRDCSRGLVELRKPQLHRNRGRVHSTVSNSGGVASHSRSAAWPSGVME